MDTGTTDVLNGVWHVISSFILLSLNVYSNASKWHSVYCGRVTVR